MVPLVNFILEHYMHEQGYLPREFIIINYLLDFFYFSSPADSRSTATKNWHDFPCHGRQKPAKSDADGVKQKKNKNSNAAN